MAFHELLEKSGGVGRYQFLQIIFLMICSLMVDPLISLENFTGVTPDHRCWVDILDNGTVSNNTTGIFSQESLVRIFIPLDSNLRPEKCRRFIHPQWQLLHLNGTFSNVSELETESCMDGWVYDNSSFLSTTVTEWDLVCESQSLLSVSKFLFMAGALVGNILHGYLTDRFGRKLVFKICLLQLAITTTCTIFSPNFLIYCSLRFLTGFSTMTIKANSIMLTMEWILPPWQTRGVVLISATGTLGTVLLAGTAFAVQKWRTIQLVVSVPLFVLFLCSRWLVESARWLIVNNKPEKGLKVLKKVACINGRKTTEDTLTLEVLEAAMKEEMQRAQSKPSLGSLFRMPALRRRICILLFVRFALSMCLFGLLLHLEHLGNNVFLTQVLFGTLGCLGCFLVHPLLKFLGRRISHATSLCIAGILILGTAYTPQEMQNLRVALSTLGVIFNAMTGIINMTYSNELLPTTTRATALGMIGIAGSVGGAVAPLLMILRTYHAPLPWIIYAVTAIPGGLAVLFLPETRNQPLPDTIQDLEKRKGSRLGRLDNAPTNVTVLRNSSIWTVDHRT